MILVLVAIFLVRDRPKTTEQGYAEEFAPALGAAGQENQEQLRIWRMTDFLCSRNFWLLSVGVGLLFGVDQAILVSQVPFFQDLGFDLKTAALLVSVKTLSAIGGKLIVGALADRVDLRILFIYIAVSNMALLAIYTLQPSFWTLLASVTLLGVAVGGVFPVWTTMLAWLFGPRSYGSAMGLMIIVIQVFAVVVMRFVGEVYDKTGSYVPAFGAFIAMVLTSIVLIALLRPERDNILSNRNCSSPA